MLKHIVLFKFREGAEKAENMNKVKSMLEALPSNISEIRFFEVGKSFNPNGSHDLVLYSEFDSEDALYRYQKHPEHIKVVGLVDRVCESRIAADYII